METQSKVKITVECTVNAPIEKVWKLWTSPEDIKKWCNASDDWHAPKAENDLKKGGRFTTRMEAKDGSVGFDFGGVYDAIITNQLIAYTMGDGRQVAITFVDKESNETRIIETFEAENENPVEMQRGGWQAILNNFKNYAETN
ncbi:MAG TPA: SRPBCC family protein [Bacteroidia bacterium]|nr:SRPBCC family protein [Bacteroidia bacterium]